MSFVALAITIAAAGSLIESLAPSLVPRTLRGLTRVVLGLVSWMALLFAMGTLGVLSPPAIRTVAVVVTIGALAIRARRSGLRGTAPTRAALPWRARAWMAAPSLSIVFVLGVLFVLALRPSPAWDASTYHLTIPRLYLEHGGFRPIQFNVYSNWPLNEELLFALGLALHDHLLATLVQWMFAGLILWALWAGCARAGAPSAGPIAGALFLASDVVLFEASVAYVDLGLAFFFLMGLLYFLEAERDANAVTPHLLLAGVSCGAMAGVKLTGIVGAPIIAGLWLWRSWRRGSLTQGIREASVCLLLPTLVLVLPWYAKAAWYTGNPLYPFFYEALRGVDWSRRLGEQFQTWQASMGMGRTWRDDLLLPWRVITAGGPGFHRFDGALTSGWLLAVPTIVVGCWRSRDVRRAGLAGLLYFALWAASSQQMRFLLPAVAVLSLAAATALVRWVDALPSGSRRDIALGIVGVALSYELLRAAAPRIDESRAWLARYADRGSAIVEEAPLPIERFINQSTPADARLLLLNLNRGFFIRRDYVADSFFEASQIHALWLRNHRVSDIEAEFRKQQFTHVLVGYEGWGIPYPSTLTDFLNNGADVVYTSPQGDVLYAIRRP